MRSMFKIGSLLQSLRMEWDCLRIANDCMGACGLSKQAYFGKFPDVLLSFSTCVWFQYDHGHPCFELPKGQ